MFRLKHLPVVCAALASFGSASAQPSPRGHAPLFLTATNGATNFLAIVNSKTQVVDYVPTGGQGGIGAGSNEGAVAVSGNLAAVINYGSSNVSIFERQGDTMEPIAMVPTVAPPVSVDFGHGHLIVLETTMAESFPVYGTSVSGTADGAVALAKADGSAGEIKSFDGGAIYIEKSGSISMLNLSTNGSPGLSGPNVAIALPAAPNNDTPLGMATRGADAYISIAHSNYAMLVANGKMISGSAGPAAKDASGNIVHAACWLALSGQFLYAADSPSHQIVRYLVSDASVFHDKEAVATFTGKPLDLAISQSLLGVIDTGDGTTSNASLFSIDSDGELRLLFSVKISGPINGAAIVR